MNGFKVCPECQDSYTISFIESFKGGFQCCCGYEGELTIFDEEEYFR